MATVTSRCEKHSSDLLTIDFTLIQSQWKLKQKETWAHVENRNSSCERCSEKKCCGKIPFDPLTRHQKWNIFLLFVYYLCVKFLLFLAFLHFSIFPIFLLPPSISIEVVFVSFSSCRGFFSAIVLRFCNFNCCARRARKKWKMWTQTNEIWSLRFDWNVVKFSSTSSASSSDLFGGKFRNVEKWESFRWKNEPFNFY